MLSSYFKLETSVAFAVASLLITQAGADAVDRSGNLRENHSLLEGREIQEVTCWLNGASYSVGQEVTCSNCEYDVCTCQEDNWGNPTWGNCRNLEPANPPTWQPPPPVPPATAEPTSAPVTPATPEPTPAPVPPATAEPTSAPVTPATPEPTAGGNDCSTDFCETTLTDGYLLKYKLNDPDSLDGTISMELVYDGVAWVGIAFSEDERMGGSNGVIASPGSGDPPQKYRLGQGVIEIMPTDEQTLTDASVEVVNGQTVMKFTKPMVEPDQIAVTIGENKMLWANGGDSTTIGYHGTNRAPFSLNLGGSAPSSSAEPQVGDEICITGYIMDTFCINRGTLLDAPDVVTLQNPELHSYHCLLDVPPCYESGFNVLGDKDPTTGLYCLGYRLDDTNAVAASGRAAGSVADGCTTCSGDGMGKMGYRATVKGTIKELGDGTESVTGQPVLTDIQMLDESVVCATPAPKTVCLGPPKAETDLPPVTPSAGEKGPSAGDCSTDFCETTLTDGYLLRYKLNEPDETVTMELVYDGVAWVGIAFSEDERMGGSDAVLASPGSGAPPQKYRLGQGVINGLMSPDEQTLTDASVEVVNGQTVMKFTKPLVEPNQIEVQLGNNFMLWAHGGDSTTIGYHGANRSPFSLNLSSGESAALSAANKGAWLAHGICAFIAWGVLAPTAVNSSIYRSLFKGPLWFKLHRFFNASAYALTITAFAIAVAYISKEGNPHWNTSHAKMGLSMFIIASVQVLWGAARPHLPAPDSGEEKTAIRKVWEFKHRLTGTVLLACGFWQMSAGIKLFAGKYSGVGSVQEQGVTIAYWIWIGFEVVLLLIGGVYFKALRKNVENVDENEGDVLVQAESTTKQKGEAVQPEDVVDENA